MPASATSQPHDSKPNLLMPARSFCARLVVTVLALNLFVTGLAALSLYQSRLQYERRAANQVENLAQSLNLTLAALLDKASLSVISITTEAERQIKSGRLDTTALTAYILRQKSHVPELDGLRVLNDVGDIISGEGVTSQTKVNLADREVFIRPKKEAQAGIIIGSPILGRFSNKWIFIVGHRINNPDGSFAGVVYGTISLDYLGKIFATFDLGKQGVITFRDRELAIMKRYPEPPGGKATPTSKVVSPEMRAMVQAGRTSGTYYNQGSVDTTPRLFSFKKIDGYPLYINSGLAASEYLAPWYGEVRQTGSLVALFLVASLFAAWLVYTNRRRELAAEEEITNYRDHLEETVKQRTEALEINNSQLIEEVNLRRRVEQDLRRSAIIMDRISDVVCWVDGNGVFSYVNDTACTLYGYQRDELMAMSLVDVSVEFSADAWRHKWEVLQHEKALTFEAKHKSRNRDEFPVEVSASYIIIDAIEYCCLIIRDLSELKEAETLQRQLMEQLSQSQKLESVGRLAGGIAHDFNNLLTPILGYAELMQANFPADGQDFARMNLIMQAADKARKLTQQLLGFSRKQILEMKTVDLNEVITHFYEILRRTIRENIEINLHLTGYAYGVRADRNQIEQVLLNLAINAQDAIADKGLIAIETAPMTLDEEYARQHSEVVPGRYLMLALSDNGCGMDQETCSRIFEPFFTTKEMGKGTGLGLSTIFGVVKQHGGHIFVYSEVGKGTVFKLYFPVSDEKPWSEVAATAEALQTITHDSAILLVEDDEMVRNLVFNVLDSRGYKAHVAENSAHALQLGRSEHIDMLLTDVVMKEMNGPELYQKLLQGNPGLKVLYMSGYTNNVIEHHGLLNKGINFIQKPFAANDLTAKIEQVLSLKK